MNLDKWAVVKVLCTDGIERLGMIQEEGTDLAPERVILGGLTEAEAEISLKVKAKKMGLEEFDNDEDYHVDKI
jgi:hypothetical protein